MSRVPSLNRCHKIVLRNPRWGTLDGASFWLTPGLHKKLAKRRDRTGTLFLDRLAQGRAIRGLKHLIETLRSIDSKAELIFTDNKTTRLGSQYYVDLSDFTAFGQTRFLSLYRTAGLDVAGDFVRREFSNLLPPQNLTTSEIRKAEKHFGDVVDVAAKKVKQRKQLLKKTSEVVAQLKNQESALRNSVQELDELKRQSSVALYIEKVDELRKRLERSYSETSGRHSWQAWIYENNWIMGVQYSRPIQKQQVGFSNIPDYLFPTMDGFLDILEIKKPEHEVIREDASHTGSFAWSSECNKAIGQVTNYLYEMELHQLELKDKINKRYRELLGRNVYIIRPRAFIIIGRSADWNAEYIEALRKLNHTLHGIEIITYSDLTRRGEHIISLYADSPTT